MAHSHSHGTPTSGKRMVWSIGLTLTFVIGEVVAGYLSHSLALLSDAGHNFADALALILSAYAIWIAKKQPNARKTYGYHRVGILAALVNAVSLVVIAIFIGIEAIGRLAHPVTVHAGPMIWVALAAIGVNVLIALLVRAGSKDDINMRSAYLHMVGDAVAAFGVVIAGIVVAITGQSIADPIVSVLIAAMILWSSWGILRESVDILLEATPAGIDLKKVEQTIRKVAGVLGVHDLHVWTVGPGAIACSCHILVAEQTVREGEQVLQAVIEELEHHHHINHTTVQVEVEGCASNEIYCTIKPLQEEHAGHHH